MCEKIVSCHVVIAKNSHEHFRRNLEQWKNRGDELPPGGTGLFAVPLIQPSTKKGLQENKKKQF